jgi:hypothetical protein
MLKKSKNLFKIEFIKTLIIVLIVLASTWGITFALNNNIEDATLNFSVLGTVATVSDSTITLIDARGSDDSGKNEYEINIDYLERVETRDYEPLIITDIKPGDTISGQGLTNGSLFFIKRIISFSYMAAETELATTTDVLIEEVSTTSEEIILNESEATSSQETSSTTSNSIVGAVTDVIGDVVDTVIDTVTDVIGGVIDVITGTTTDPVIDDTQTEENATSTSEETSNESTNATSTSDNNTDEEVTPDDTSPVEDSETVIEEEVPADVQDEPGPVILE